MHDDNTGPGTVECRLLLLAIQRIRLFCVADAMIILKVEPHQSFLGISIDFETNLLVNGLHLFESGCQRN